MTLSDTHNPPGWLYQVCRQGVVSLCRSAVFVTSVPVEPVSRLLLSPDWPMQSSADKKKKKKTLSRYRPTSEIAVAATVMSSLSSGRSDKGEFKVKEFFLQGLIAWLHGWKHCLPFASLPLRSSAPSFGDVIYQISAGADCQKSADTLRVSVWFVFRPLVCICRSSRPISAGHRWQTYDSLVRGCGNVSQLRPGKQGLGISRGFWGPTMFFHCCLFIWAHFILVCFELFVSRLFIYLFIAYFCFIFLN